MLNKLSYDIEVKIKIFLIRTPIRTYKQGIAIIFQMNLLNRVWQTDLILHHFSVSHQLYTRFTSNYDLRSTNTFKII